MQKKEAEIGSVSFLLCLKYKCFCEKRLAEFYNEYHRVIDITGVLGITRD